MTEEVATVAGQYEKRKRPAYPRQALEQYQREVCTFTSLWYCEMTERMVVGARQHEMRKWLAQSLITRTKVVWLKFWLI